MFNFDNWQEIFETIGKNKLRTFLTAFSVSWGIFMLVMLLGFGKGLQQGVEHTFSDDAVNSLWVFSGKTSIPHKGMTHGRAIQFRNSDYEMLKEQPDVELIAARFRNWNTSIVSYKNESNSFDIRSTHPDHLHIEMSEIVKGRFLNDADLKEFRKVAVIGTLVADFLFKDEDPIGKHITISGISFRVIGVFEDQGGENELRKIYIPISTAQRAFNGNDKIDMVMFTINPDATVEQSKEMERAVIAMFAEKHGFSPDDPRAVRIRNNLENFMQFRNLFRYIEIFVWFVGILTVVAGVVGVGNIMMITVKERTKEIGIRKALGATPFSIVSLIMQEAVLITVFSGYFGLMLGVGLLELVNYGVARAGGEMGFFRNPSVDFHVAMIATLFLVVAGSVAGLIPAMKAASINPIVAIREE